jgi:4-hydroxy-3-methylbut-2-enyl diphosphate reductase
MGVRRAVDLAEEELAPDGSAVSGVYSYGPLIHNPQILRALEKRGLGIIDENDPANPVHPSVVLVRAHGINPALEENIRRRGARIVDATCPKVKANQKTALNLARRGLIVFIAGEKTHAEVQGIAGYVEAGAAMSGKTASGKSVALDEVSAGGTACPRAWIIVGNAAEAKAAAYVLRREQPGVKAALIAQTTLSEDEYALIAEAITETFPDLEIHSTICGATRERQDALRELCIRCDAIVIAGGKESANTRRLLAIARQCGKPAWLIETAADLPPELKEYQTLGLSAGASTPDGVIEEIFAVLTRGEKKLL